MRKNEFIIELRRGLSGLPGEDIEERVSFYTEMIDDRIEEGLDEEEAVAAIGNVEDIISQTVADIPFAKIAKERINPKRKLGAWEIVLLAIGSPIWLSLIVVALAVILSLYVILWSVIVTLWAVFGALCSCSLGGVVAGIIFAVGAHAPTGIALIGAGILLAGLSIFMFFGCNAATKGIVILSPKIILWIKSCFIKKGGDANE